MPKKPPKLDHLLWALGGAAAGAWWVKNENEEAQKSRAENDDPEGVEEVCETVGPVLDDWDPDDYDNEDSYVADLFKHLDANLPKDFDVEMFPSIREGKPDILIDDRLALELKVNPRKGERDRLVGQTAAYSREWVTWIVLVDTPESKAGALEKLLADKGLERILVFGF